MAAYIKRQINDLREIRKPIIGSDAPAEWDEGIAIGRAYDLTCTLRTTMAEGEKK